MPHLKLPDIVLFCPAFTGTGVKKGIKKGQHENAPRF
jgi:hypothetical protein